MARPIYSVSLSGFVETRDIRERTDRFVLRVASMDSPRAVTKLEWVRLSVRKGTAPAVGSFVELKARLQPPLAPLRPGSYDFGRDMYFQGIGASGFAMGAIKTLEPPEERRPVAALCRLHAGPARCDRCANTNRIGWRQAGDCDRAIDRSPRRDFHPRQRRHVHLRPWPRAVDFRLKDRTSDQDGSGSVTVHNYRCEINALHVTNQITKEHHCSQRCFPGASQPNSEVLPMPAL
jgi:Domain of unknown function (DUF4131)